MRCAAVIWLLLAGAAQAQTVAVLPTEATSPVANGSCLLVDQLTSMTAAISGTTMTVSAIASGNMAVGDQVAGAAPGTAVTALGGGTGGTGTYTVAPSQSLSSASLTARGNRKLCSGFATALGGVTTPAQTVWGNFTSGSVPEQPNPVPDTPDTAGKRLNFVQDTGFIAGTSVGGGDREMGIPAGVTGTASATPVMMGLSSGVGTQRTLIVPARNGRFLIWARGWNSGAVAATYRMVVGTGAPPANGAAVPAGSLTVGNTQNIVPATGSNRMSWSCTAIVSGLAIGTQYWVDVSWFSPAGGTTSALNTNITAVEN